MVRPAPDCSEEDWATYLYLRSNIRGDHAERWRHAHGCGQFFNVIRDTATDRISETYPADHQRPALGREI